MTHHEPCYSTILSKLQVADRAGAMIKARNAGIG